MPDFTPLNSARGIFAQTKRNTAGLRGSLWAGVLLVLLIVVVPVELIFTVLLFHGVMHASVSALQEGGVLFSVVILSQLLNLLMGVFIAVPVWVGVSHCRGQSVGAWTAFKYVAKRYWRLFCFSLLLCVLSGVLSSLTGLIAGSLQQATAWSWVSPTLTIVFDIALWLFVLSVIYVLPLLLETKHSVSEAIKASWLCVRTHKQGWLLIRTSLLLVLWVATIGIIVLFPMYLHSLVHYAKWLFQTLTLILMVWVVIWGIPFLIMLPNTLYCHFFDAQGEITPVRCDLESEEE